MLDRKESGSFSPFPHHAIEKNYFDAIAMAGGLPVGIPCDSGTTGDYLSRLDGVLVPGGNYQSPAEWYADGIRSDYTPNPARAEGELALLKNLLQSKKPLLGICAGMQVMNVALGGNLTSKLPDHPVSHRHSEGMDRYDLRHTLKITPGTLLHAINGDTMRANTHHREGVALLAPGAIASAHAEDGVIEAIEWPRHPFALGVQWHPEHSTGDLQNLKIFTAFVAACAGK